MPRSARHLMLALAALAASGPAAAQDFPLMLYEPGTTDRNAFLPIAYACPPAKDGTVELIKMNAVGGRVRFHVTFAGDAVRHATVHRAWRDAPLSVWFEFADPTKPPAAPGERSVLQAALNDTQGIRSAICLGAPGIREKYDKILEHNRTHMKPARMD